MSWGARARRQAARLFEPVDAASLAVFRVVVGLAIAADVVRYWAHGWIHEYYIRPRWSFPLVDGLAPWPGDGMYLHYAAIGVAALAVACGLFYRAAAVALFALYTWVFLLEKAVYLNHHYLLCLLCFLLVWMQPHRTLSLDRWRHPEWSPTAPRWNVLLARFQLVVVYAYGAIAKLDPDWLRGEPMFTAILQGELVVPGTRDLAPATVALGIAWGGILVDALVPVLLCVRRTRWLGFAIAVVFHLLNDFLFRLGVFSYLMIGLLPIFFAPDWPRRLLPAHGDGVLPPAPSRMRRGLVLGALSLYAGAQLLVPLRHWLYPGDVAWTEEGHRFSWRMKLRSKRGHLQLWAVDRATGEAFAIDPLDDLTRRQWMKLRGQPDMLLQYVHYKRDELATVGIDAAIHVEWECSVNGSPPRLLVDPDVDLAREAPGLAPARWILRH